MKKMRAAVMLLCLVLCLTGCMRFNTTITVKRNGKFDISMLIAMVNMADSETAITEEQKREYERQGWEVEEYNKDNYLGVILKKYDLTPEDVEESVESTDTSVSDGAGDFNFSKEGLKYVIDWKLNPESSTQEETYDADKYAQYFEQFGGFMTLGINLPVKPLASNATSVSDDGKSLEWDLLALDKEMTIHVEFMLINIRLIIALIAAGVLVIAAIIIAIVLVSKKKNRVPSVSTSTWSGDLGWGSGNDLDLTIEGTAGNTVQTAENAVNNTVSNAASATEASVLASAETVNAAAEATNAAAEATNTAVEATNAAAEATNAAVEATNAAAEAINSATETIDPNQQ